MSNPSHGSRDTYIIDALNSGYITVNPRTGMVYDKHGEPKTTANSNGYHVVGVGGGRHAFVHRVVWIAANGPIGPGLEINHRNSDKGDNHIWNLEAVTPKQNAAHAHRLPTYEGFYDTDVMAADPDFLLRLIHGDTTLLDERFDDEEPDEFDPYSTHRLYGRRRLKSPKRPVRGDDSQGA